MKRLLSIILIVLLGLFCVVSTAAAWEDDDLAVPKNQELSDDWLTPQPPLENVSDDKLIVPGEGVAGAKFGMKIKDVEEILGRGELHPKETDFFGNSVVNLVYPDLFLVFQFLNGEMALIVIDNPEFGTKEGTHVRGEIGDAFRELGTEFRKDKSIVQDPDPEKQLYDIYFDKQLIAFKCRGRVITQILLRTPHRIKTNTKK